MAQGHISLSGSPSAVSMEVHAGSLMPWIDDVVATSSALPLGLVQLTQPLWRSVVLVLES
jgi:hypothetical protein